MFKFKIVIVIVKLMLEIGEREDINSYVDWIGILESGWVGDMGWVAIRFIWYLDRG